MIELDCVQGSEEWLNARAGACTASRFSVARERMKVNRGDRKAGQPTEACEKYAMLLAIERIYGQHLDDTFKTWQMERGQHLEPVARGLYESRTGYMVETAGILLTDDRMFGYSTDGKVYGEPGRLEIKVPAASDKVAGVWVNPAPIIAEYQDQCDGGLWLTGDQWIDLVIYTPWLESVGRALFIHRIHRDEARIEALERDLMEFYRLTRDYEAKLRAPADDASPPWEPSASAPAPKSATTVAPQDIAEPQF